MTSIVSKRFEEWPIAVQRRLIRATLPDGSMRFCVRKKPSSRTFVAFDEGGRVMGWLLLWPTRETGIFATVFVNKRYRKDGIAVKLFDAAIAQERPLNVLGWDEASLRLFRKVQERHPGALVIVDWVSFRTKYGQLQENGS